MRHCIENPAAGDGGASERRACRLDASDNNQNRRALQDSARIDEMLWKLGERLRAGRFDDWERDFAWSVFGQAKRPRWSPSARQMAIIQRLIDKPAPSAEPTESLIDDGGQVK